MSVTKTVTTEFIMGPDDLREAVLLHLSSKYGNFEAGAECAMTLVDTDYRDVDLQHVNIKIEESTHD